ncbi:hypothetical protein D3C74_395950 [compost metagenome]
MEQIRMMMGVVIRMLPSLLKKMVMRKQSNRISQNNRKPEPRAFSIMFTAIQRKKPMLSRIMDMTMVERIVIAAPDTISKMPRICPKLLTPVRIRSSAPSEVGIDSFNPPGRHIRKMTVMINTPKVNHNW